MSVWAVLAIVGAAVVIAAGLIGYTTLSQRAASSDSTTATETPDGAIGEPVSDGEFQFVITDISGQGPNYYGPRAQGQWVFVTMTVRNTGDEPQSFFVQNQKLIDTRGREFAPDMSATKVIGSDSTMMLNMNPGFGLTAKVVYDVPPGTKPAVVEVHDSMISGGARVSVG
jgi:hypothetical protein